MVAVKSFLVTNSMDRLLKHNANGEALLEICARHSLLRTLPKLSVSISIHGQKFLIDFDFVSHFFDVY